MLSRSFFEPIQIGWFKQTHFISQTKHKRFPLLRKKFITSGEGAAEVAKTTGYMPPNKAANEIILADFYKANPNKQTAVDQLPLLRDWLAYPGDKGLAITQVIYDGMEKLVTGEASDVADLQQEMAEEAGDLMPR